MQADLVLDIPGLPRTAFADLFYGPDPRVAGGGYGGGGGDAALPAALRAALTRDLHASTAAALRREPAGISPADFRVGGFCPATEAAGDRPPPPCSYVLAFAVCTVGPAAREAAVEAAVRAMVSGDAPPGVWSFFHTERLLRDATGGGAVSVHAEPASSNALSRVHRGRGEGAVDLDRLKQQPLSPRVSPRGGGSVSPASAYSSDPSGRLSSPRGGRSPPRSVSPYPQRSGSAGGGGRVVTARAAHGAASPSHGALPSRAEDMSLQSLPSPGPWSGHTPVHLATPQRRAAAAQGNDVDLFWEEAVAEAAAAAAATNATQPQKPGVLMYSDVVAAADARGQRHWQPSPQQQPQHQRRSSPFFDASSIQLVPLSPQAPSAPMPTPAPKHAEQQQQQHPHHHGHHGHETPHPVQQRHQRAPTGGGRNTGVVTQTTVRQNPRRPSADSPPSSDDECAGDYYYETPDAVSLDAPAAPPVPLLSPTSDAVPAASVDPAPGPPPRYMGGTAASREREAQQAAIRSLTPTSRITPPPMPQHAVEMRSHTSTRVQQRHGQPAQRHGSEVPLEVERMPSPSRTAVERWREKRQEIARRAASGASSSSLRSRSTPAPPLTSALLPLGGPAAPAEGGGAGGAPSAPPPPPQPPRQNLRERETLSVQPPAPLVTNSDLLVVRRVEAARAQAASSSSSRGRSHSAAAARPPSQKVRTSSPLSGPRLSGAAAAGTTPAAAVAVAAAAASALSRQREAGAALSAAPAAVSCGTVMRQIRDLDETIAAMSPGASQQQQPTTPGTPAGSSSSHPQQQAAEQFVVVSENGALVRQTVDFHSAQVAMLQPGTVVHVVEKQHRRARIAAPAEGWVSVADSTGGAILQPHRW